MVVTPANDTTAPAIFASPRRLLTSTISIPRMMAMTKVIEATAFTMEVTKVGDVYFRLEKNMFSVKLPLQDQEPTMSIF
jgi:hypothetical protein